MASFFKRLRRSAGKLIKPAARLAAASLTGGASEAALRVAKGIGAYATKRAAKLQPASVTALIDRTVSNTSRMVTDRQRGPALTMPGGAPIPTPTLKIMKRQAPKRRRAAKRLKLPEAISAELANQAAPMRPLGVRDSF